MLAMVTMVKDDWVRAAMMDDSVVVELLVRLKQAQAAPSVGVAKSSVASLRWGIRQPRSRSLRCDAVSHKKEADSATRGSPTTPLSWSGGGRAGSASPSATVDGFEEASRQTSRFPVVGTRSKVSPINETTSSSNRRLRRKKTFAELKEEESLLLKERVNLKKEIATLRATYKEQSARNENLKKMKIDLNLQCAKNLCSTSDESEKEISEQSQQRVASSADQVPTTLSRYALVDDHQQSDSCETHKHVPAEEEGLFLLPDLNMMPCEDDSAIETLYGTS